tara:strand:- start:615 stop:866 length:252 start_codon:yes stop_codon:yes gene_type:complete
MLILSTSVACLSVNCGGDPSPPINSEEAVSETVESKPEATAISPPAPREPSLEERAAEELRKSGEAAEAEIMARAAGGFVGDE